MSTEPLPPDLAQEVLDHVRAVLARSLDLDHLAVVIEPRQQLRELPGADSLGLLRAIVELEGFFSVSLDDDDVFELHTVGDLCALIARRMT
ncbi:acyl carrier protein [Streptomyces sp. NPDC051546]|uniref:acyl carrier protein n=1 Tax=Streptomyces sp. NPDC051546 TaxID=3365655 RepID=UPI00379C8443